MNITPPGKEAQKAIDSVAEWTGGTGFYAYKLNPVVTLCSVVFIWGFICYTIANPDMTLKGINEAAFIWLQEIWIWFYIISQNIWMFILIWIATVKRWADLKLGPDHEPPAYSFATWFSLLFTAGIAVGLFYFAIAEPVYHYKGIYGGKTGSAGAAVRARFISDAKGYGNTNEDAIHGIMVTWFHWGVHGWIAYTCMGAVLGILTHRRGFPLTIRYIMYPLIGTGTHGYIGDFIDSFSIITTLFGVCSSLGIGAMQMNDGLQRLSHGFFQGALYGVPPNKTMYSQPRCGGQGKRCEPGQVPYGVQTNTETQLIIIVCITCCATASVVTGMSNGIVTLSRISFALGMFIVVNVLFLGETYHTFDVLCQSFGYYLFYLMKIGFYTDAYESLDSAEFGLGGASDEAGSKWWMPGWTLFYFGWWISWAPFVGTFIAKISRGRTLRQFIVGTLFVPSLYSFFWMGIFGAEGIRMQRLADSSGLCNIAKHHDISGCHQEGVLVAPTCYAYAASYTREDKMRMRLGFDPDCVLDPVWHNGLGRCKEFRWDRRQEVGNNCVQTVSWVFVPCNKHPQAYGGPGNGSPGAVKDPTALPYPPVRGPCKGKILMAEVDPRSSKRTFNWFYGAQPECFVPVPDNIVCLTELDTPGEMFYDMLSCYGPNGFGYFMCTVAVCTQVLYFVTSSDSGSYVVDMLASNGDEDPPLSQRIFWSVTEGATAAAVLYAGKNLPDSQGALNSLKGASMLCGLPFTFILFWCTHSLILLCKEECGDVTMDRKRFKIQIFSLEYPTRILVHTVLPGVVMGRFVGTLGGWPFHASSPRTAEVVWTVVFNLLYWGAISLTCINGIMQHWHIIGLCLYIGYSFLLALVRNTVRRHVEIDRGDLFSDWFTAFCVPMFTLTQLEVEMYFTKEETDPDMKKGANLELLTMYGLPKE